MGRIQIMTGLVVQVTEYGFYLKYDRKTAKGLKQASDIITFYKRTVTSLSGIDWK